MARISLERLLETLDTQESRVNLGIRSGDNSKIYVDLGNGRGREQQTVLSLSEAFLAMVVKKGLTKNPKYVQRVRQIFEERIAIWQQAAYRFGDFEQIRQLVSLAQSIRHKELEESLYLEHVTRLTREGGYGYVSAGEFAMQLGKRKDARNFFRQALAVTRGGMMSRECYKNARPEERTIDYDSFIDFAKASGDAYLLRQIYNKRIRRHAQKGEFVPAMNHCLDAEKDARNIEQPGLTKYFQDKADKYRQLHYERK